MLVAGLAGMLPRRLVLTVVATVALAGCEGEAEITADDARSPEPPTHDVAAVYLELVNRGDADAVLVDVSTEHAADVELHETVVDDGAATMREADELVVPAGERVALEEGGWHLMLVEPEPLSVGDRIDLTLEFDAHEPIAVDVTVTELGGPGEDGGHGDDGSHGDGEDDGDGGDDEDEDG
ncbi:copper chaperone PCu(A)C [Egibacter rhizosphaerae]|uniref:Copper chaperone PCu(A)C n=1 Tax=Egibacter rhizosphaerae TaxID=1670831 RepID=A0A411YKW1_9ACTN|nr:copper chaperone PCu(A)C [Egibacter rhizosphaerae]QBI21826.1 copper chaperone PCu(A)C [Egibacter rhizosphaerae]